MAGNGGDLLATFPNSILDVLEHYFTGNWVAFYGELGGNPCYKSLRVNGLRRLKCFIYLILSIKIYIRALLADANALYIINSLTGEV